MIKAVAPFRLEPVSVETIWAAPALQGPMAGHMNIGRNIGEVWLASGREQVNVVANGPLQGMRLDELENRLGPELLGENKEFPFSLKLLNVGEWLSVQVEDNAKEEGWHVLHSASPDTEIVMGLKLGTGRQEVEEAVERGNITELLAKIPAHDSDTFFLPSGTVRSVGPGLLIFEMKQPGGTAFRVHDWNRPDSAARPLHHAKALRALSFMHAPSEPVRPIELYSAPNRLRLLLETSTSALLRVDARQIYRPWWGGAKLRVIFMLQGNGQICSPGGYFEPMPIEAGQTWVLPARRTTPLLIPKTDNLSFLEAVA